MLKTLHHSDPFVIITNSADEAWDATDMKGIKSIYALKVNEGVQKASLIRECTMYMRDHPCFCEPCRNRDSERCTQKHTVGCWKPIKITKKINQKVYNCVPLSQRDITKFFNGLILQNDRTIIVGLSMTDKESGEKHLKFGTLAVPPRLNMKEALSHEHHIDNLHYDVHVPKGAAVVRVKMLLRHPNTTHQLFLPPNSKMNNFPITDSIYPSSILLSNSSLDRNSYVTYWRQHIPIIT
jgi:hypothetical protein